MGTQKVLDDMDVGAVLRWLEEDPLSGKANGLTRTVSTILLKEQKRHTWNCDGYLVFVG